MSLQITMGYDEILAIGDLDLFLEKTKELCEMKLRGKFFPGMDKEDVVQEVLINVYQAINSFDSSKAKASTFFESVVNNRIADCIKKVNRQSNLAISNAVELVGELTSTETDCQPQGQTLVIGIDDANYSCTEYMLDFMNNIGLDEREKKIFNLRCAGYDFSEIAGFLDLSKARISQLWKGILRKYESA